ncbi:hypothetical protein [Bacillus cereus]|uniref:hypothetical protein n=1 Tax=Bacillus cereus TaxID=1396 RepID=UPI000BEBB994|nr:hypothetical protein [Bacillus cereus]PEE32732.1 hypothetical protein CON59_29450 [Bacillus cereus]PET35415.1 hypothetical protein CN523_31030 [Bacillus cereus]PEV82587.1 hypothetical protein CN429_13765 [Bacillus cereus]PFA44788.1 hypothetical protein CN389_27250 [Bacillus cereus]PFD80583.1 hypothetical protein CN271_00975 [Bacillus cereus]
MVNIVYFDNIHTNLSPAKIDCSKLAVLVALLEENLAVYFQHTNQNSTSAIIKKIESREEHVQIIEIIEELIMKINTEHGLKYPPYSKDYINTLWRLWKIDKKRNILLH